MVWLLQGDRSAVTGLENNIASLEASVVQATGYQVLSCSDTRDAPVAARCRSVQVVALGRQVSLRLTRYCLSHATSEWHRIVVVVGELWHRYCRFHLASVPRLSQLRRSRFLAVIRSFVLSSLSLSCSCSWHCCFLSGRMRCPWFS